MKNLRTLTAIISIVTAHQSQAQAQFLKPPTWSLHCTPSSQAGEDSELILGVERLPPGNVAKATWFYESHLLALFENIEDE